MGTEITKTGITGNKISGRGGLPLFLRYSEQIGLYGLIKGNISSQFSGNRKGLQLQQFIKQAIVFFIDGTNMAISSFDQRKKDQGYASLLECKTDQMASSHQIKRFFGKVSCISGFVFNKILNELFKSSGMNRANYFMLVFTHFLFEAYKQDVTAQVIPVAVYPNTFRRKLIDFAVKITSRARNIVLNVTKSIYKTINIELLWKRCQSPPQIQLA